MLFLDKQGTPFEVRKGGREDVSLLVEMYETFQPKGKFQGVPPIAAGACSSWLRHLFETGENYLAARERRFIGHAALLPDTAFRDGEYLVFVHQHHRGRGVGTRLTRSVLDRARALGLMEIWLTVDAGNFIAIRLYRKFGFCFRDDAGLHGERKMSLILESGKKLC
jgi:RimJ/RimL family protein N-acetyltransferase